MFRTNTKDRAREQVTVRRAHGADQGALASLAALDSGRAPEGAALVAESGARILAALPLGSGRAIADPFEPTAELVALLELRRDQLDRAERAATRSPGARLRGLFRVAAPQGRG
jgi:hypothetical protein